MQPTLHFQRIFSGALVTACIFGLSLPAWAAGDVHVHGLAKATVAIDGKAVQLVVEVPAHDVFGFEHKPSKAEDIVTYSRQKKKLSESGATILSLAGDRQCSVKLHEYKDGMAKAGHHDDHGHGHDHNKKKKHDHGHDHGHGHGHDHDHDKKKKKHDHDHGHGHDHDDHDDEHSDVRVEYRFRCGQDVTGSSAEFNLHTVLPKLKKVEVTILGESQRAVTVTQAKTKIKL